MQYVFKHFELDVSSFELRLYGKHVSIEPQAFNVLSYLVKNHDRIVSKDELSQELWYGRIISESTVNTCIKAARKSVGDDGKSQSFIKTYYRRGFQFISPVVHINRASDVQLPSSIDKIVPHIPSNNMPEASSFLINQLGFRPTFNTEFYSELSSGNHLVGVVHSLGKPNTQSLYLRVRDINHLWSNLEKKLGNIKAKAPFDQEYGMREVHVIIPATNTLLLIGSPI